MLVNKHLGTEKELWFALWLSLEGSATLKGRETVIVVESSAGSREQPTGTIVILALFTARFLYLSICKCLGLFTVIRVGILCFPALLQLKRSILCTFSVVSRADDGGSSAVFFGHSTVAVEYRKRQLCLDG